MALYNLKNCVVHSKQKNVHIFLMPVLHRLKIAFVLTTFVELDFLSIDTEFKPV